MTKSVMRPGTNLFVSGHMPDAHHERRAKPGANELCAAQGHMLWTELVMRSGTNLFVPGHMPDAHHERREKPGANELCEAQVTCMS